jgi:hypothetical protein
MHLVPAAVASWILRGDSLEFLYVLAAAMPPVVASLMLWRTAVREIVLVLNIVVAAFYGLGGTAIGFVIMVVGTMSVSGRMAGTPGLLFVIPVALYAVTAIAVMWLCVRVMREDRIRP